MNYVGQMDSPIGILRPVVNEAGEVLRIAFPDERVEGAHPDEERVGHVVRQLREYFEGARREFDLVLKPEGRPFQHQVWELLRQIPYGETRSYGQLAAILKLASGARAVGRANGTNPIPIVVPCHRVIGANGTLTGYAGGLQAKQILLELERPNLFG